MRAERRVYVLIVASRSLSEAVMLASAAAILHTATVGRDALPLVNVSVALFGITLVLGAILRERGTVRQSTALTAIVMAAWAWWGLAQQTRSPDFLAVLTRIVGFAILGEVHLWRALSVARGLQRWREVRNDALLALVLVVAASLVPGAIDRDPLPALGLAVACTGAVALSLSRSAEELALATGQVQGRPAASSATGTAFAIGTLAIVLAAALPAIQIQVRNFGIAIGPFLNDLLFAILLPLGYLAAFLVTFVRDRLRFRPAPLEPPPGIQVGDPAADAARLRDIEQMRPFVYGALELLVAAVVLLIAGILIARLVQERRSVLQEGTTIEREAVTGIGLRETLSRLLPRLGARQRQPLPDDGTPAAAVRRLYWRLLEQAERQGPGWRGDAETPAEHEARLISASSRWSEAGPLVRAFEAVRYGERDPDPAAVDLARSALRRVEAAR